MERFHIDEYQDRLAEMDAEYVREANGRQLFYVSPDLWVVARRDGPATVRLEFYDSEEDCGC